jgi:hypothetical protein
MTDVGMRQRCRVNQTTVTGFLANTPRASTLILHRRSGAGVAPIDIEARPQLTWTLGWRGGGRRAKPSGRLDPLHLDSSAREKGAERRRQAGQAGRAERRRQVGQTGRYFPWTLGWRGDSRWAKPATALPKPSVAALPTPQGGEGAGGAHGQWRRWEEEERGARAGEDRSGVGVVGTCREQEPHDWTWDEASWNELKFWVRQERVMMDTQLRETRDANRMVKIGVMDQGADTSS